MAAALRRAGVEHVVLSTDGRLGARARAEAGVSFASPAFLAALLIVPLALGRQLLSRRRAQRYAVRFPGVATLAPLLPRVPSWRRQAPLALFLAALAALALALARPHATVAVPTEQASIVLVSDVSRSMLAATWSPTAWRPHARRRRASWRRCPRRRAWASWPSPPSPTPWSRPRRSTTEITQLIDGLAADGGTATGDALAVALRAARRPRGRAAPRRDRAAVRRRDHHRPRPDRGGPRGPPARTSRSTPSRSARAAAVIQTPDGALIPVPPDPETMREIAELSGGRSFQVEDADDLAGLYSELGSRVATEKEEREITAAFAAGGALLLLAATALGLRGAARLP